MSLDPQLDAAFPAQRAARVAITRARAARGAPAADAQRRPGRAALRRASWRTSTSSSPRRCSATERAQCKLLARLWKLRRAMTPRAQALFAPRAVALIGASGDAAQEHRPPAALPAQARLCAAVSFRSTPARKEVLGERAYAQRSPTCRGEVDHAFIMVEDVERGAGGLRPQGRAGGEHLQRRLRRRRRRRRGAPGAAGRARAERSACACSARTAWAWSTCPAASRSRVNAVLEMDALPAGSASIVSQSGTMLGTRALARRGARPRLRQAGLGGQRGRPRRGRAGRAAGRRSGHARDRCCFSRRCAMPARLARAARKAHAAGKPIVAYKLGRSALGAGARALAHRRARRQPTPRSTPTSATAASCASTCSRRWSRSRRCSRRTPAAGPAPGPGASRW